MAVSDKLRLLLREKYGLVHVPNRHRMAEWVRRTRAGCKAGLPPEDAGVAAARALFPYEFRNHAVHTAAPAMELLELADSMEEST